MDSVHVDRQAVACHSQSLSSIALSLAVSISCLTPPSGWSYVQLPPLALFATIGGSMYTFINFPLVVMSVAILYSLLPSNIS